jgi:hypothetical protein
MLGLQREQPSLQGGLEQEDGAVLVLSFSAITFTIRSQLLFRELIQLAAARKKS